MRSASVYPADRSALFDSIYRSFHFPGLVDLHATNQSILNYVAMPHHPIKKHGAIRVTDDLMHLNDGSSGGVA
jgi:hypothetical protein